MNHGESESEANEPRPLMALPGRTSDEGQSFHRYMAEVLVLMGGELPASFGPTDADRCRPIPTNADRFEWEHAARATVVSAVSELEFWPEEVFDAMIRAIVHDPNPSFNRQLIEPALAAAGHRRVQTALLDLLSNGTSVEQAGAARAWYWTQVSMEIDSAADLKAGIPTEESQREYDAVKDLRNLWRETQLRVFVSNEDLDVRRCILPGMSLKVAHYPADLSDLVATAVHIARTHPDEYIRHRVEHQV
jgi:hypothetical protein